MPSLASYTVVHGLAKQLGAYPPVAYASLVRVRMGVCMAGGSVRGRAVLAGFRLGY